MTMWLCTCVFEDSSLLQIVFFFFFFFRTQHKLDFFEAKRHHLLLSDWKEWTKTARKETHTALVACKGVPHMLSRYGLPVREKNSRWGRDIHIIHERWWLWKKKWFKHRSEQTPLFKSCQLHGAFFPTKLGLSQYMGKQSESLCQLQAIWPNGTKLGSKMSSPSKNRPQLLPGGCWDIWRPGTALSSAQPRIFAAPISAVSLRWREEAMVWRRWSRVAKQMWIQTNIKHIKKKKKTFSE